MFLWPIVKIESVYPINTAVRLRKTGEFAIIKKRTFLNSENFLNYLAVIEGRSERDLNAIYHEDVDPEDVDLGPGGLLLASFILRSDGSTVGLKYYSYICLSLIVHDLMQL